MTAEQNPDRAGFYHRVKQKLGVLKHIALLIYNARRFGKQLRSVQDNTGNIEPGDILLFSAMRNELVRIPFFLDYYRKLGVNHFLFIDNDSTDGLQDALSGMSDVSLWHTGASYKNSAFGMHWVNHLMHTHACGHWCVVCDPDEFLVYPHSETRGLRDLAGLLDTQGRSSLFTMMVDMYSEYIDSGEYAAGDVPWEVCPYFDTEGYYSIDTSYWHNLYVMGGVRARLFYPEQGANPPALNKYPFVRWKKHYNFVSSMHNLAPRRPNQAYSDDDITGCLLHFKFISRVVEKSLEEMERGEHYDNSSEYKKYNQAVEVRQRMYSDDISAKYEGWEQLVDLRMMNPGPWWC